MYLSNRLLIKLGECISQENKKTPSSEELPEATNELIVQVDGGHIPTKDKNKRSFEALCSIVYHPSSVVEIDKNHRQIIDKNCTISAIDDEQATMKTYLYHAALKQGLSSQTKVKALADGAKNCWSAISILESHCQKLELILDWFHIGMKFQVVKNALGENLKEALENVKKNLWNGKTKEALEKLSMIQNNITDKQKRSKIEGLHEYLKNNQKYLVNYSKRKEQKKVFTSQVAESHIDSIINTRHKKKQEKCNGREKELIMYYKLER